MERFVIAEHVYEYSIQEDDVVHDPEDGVGIEVRNCGILCTNGDANIKKFAREDYVTVDQVCGANVQLNKA